MKTLIFLVLTGISVESALAGGIQIFPLSRGGDNTDRYLNISDAMECCNSAAGIAAVYEDQILCMGADDKLVIRAKRQQLDGNIYGTIYNYSSAKLRVNYSKLEMKNGIKDGYLDIGPEGVNISDSWKMLFSKTLPLGYKNSSKVDPKSCSWSQEMPDRPKVAKLKYDAMNVFQKFWYKCTK